MKKCSNCGKNSLAVKACSRCLSVQYCCITCQREHWPAHKKKCKELAEQKIVERVDKKLNIIEKGVEKSWEQVKIESKRTLCFLFDRLLKLMSDYVDDDIHVSLVKLRNEIESGRDDYDAFESDVDAFVGSVPNRVLECDTNFEAAGLARLTLQVAKSAFFNTHRHIFNLGYEAMKASFFDALLNLLVSDLVGLELIFDKISPPDIWCPAALLVQLLMRVDPLYRSNRLYQLLVRHQMNVPVFRLMWPGAVGAKLRQCLGGGDCWVMPVIDLASQLSFAISQDRSTPRLDQFASLNLPKLVSLHLQSLDFAFTADMKLFDGERDHPPVQLMRDLFSLIEDLAAADSVANATAIEQAGHALLLAHMILHRPSSSFGKGNTYFTNEFHPVFESVKALRLDCLESFVFPMITAMILLSFSASEMEPQVCTFLKRRLTRNPFFVYYCTTNLLYHSLFVPLPELDTDLVDQYVKTVRSFLGPVHPVTIEAQVLRDNWRLAAVFTEQYGNPNLVVFHLGSSSNKLINMSAKDVQKLLKSFETALAHEQSTFKHSNEFVSFTTLSLSFVYAHLGMVSRAYSVISSQVPTEGPFDSFRERLIQLALLMIFPAADASPDSPTAALQLALRLVRVVHTHPEFMVVYRLTVEQFMEKFVEMIQPMLPSPAKLKYQKPEFLIPFLEKSMSNVEQARVGEKC